MRGWWTPLVLGAVASCLGDQAPPAVHTYALYRDGTLAGTETVTVTGRLTTIRTQARIGPGVDLTTRFEVDERGKPVTVEGEGRNLPWFPMPSVVLRSPFPIALLSMAATDVEDCGEDLGLRCLEIAGVAWGRSLVWLDSAGVVAAALVPTVLGKVQALRPDLESRRDTFMVLAARAVERIRGRAPPVATAAGGLVMRGGDVLDVRTGDITRRANVVIHNDRIVSVGRDVKVPAGARVLDVTGTSVIPGLWDMHAHLRHADWAPAYLAAGVTTVRDLGNELAFITSLQRHLARDGAVGPRLLLAGWIDGGKSSSYPYRANTPIEARDLVQRYFDAGFEQIKVWENLSPALLPVVTNEAHRRGMTVTGHIPGGLSLPEALSAGLDQVNHLDFLLDAVEWHRDSTRSIDALIAVLLRRGTVVDATLLIPEFRGRELHRPLTELEPGAANVPEDMRKANQLLRGSPADSVAAGRRFRRALHLVNRLHRAGVPIVAGTDQSIPGYSLLHELELYVMAGLSPLDALRAATLVPARVMGRDSVSGSVDAGKLADFVVLDGDPLADITAIRRPRYVVRGGVVFDPAALRRAAGFR